MGLWSHVDVMGLFNIQILLYFLISLHKFYTKWGIVKMALIYLTQPICDKALPTDKCYDLRDTFVRGLFLRVEVSGRKTWYLSYRTPPPEKKLKNKKIISASLVNLAAARKIAKEYLAKLYLEGVDPATLMNPEKHTSTGVTLRELIDEYEPWVNSHQKSGTVTLRALRLFKEFLDVPVSSLSTEAIERWQMDNIGQIKRATINRRIAALQAVTSWGVKHGLLDEIPFKAPKLPQTDSRVVARFLTKEERARLMSALDEREKLQGADYLKPAVILSLNTGIRKGTLLGLKWEDVDFKLRSLNLRAEIMKGGKDAVIPLNKIAYKTLVNWQKFTGADTGFIFSAADGGRRNDITRPFMRVLEKAGVKNFTWHCLRHDFASQLAIEGVTLHIIQKLLCHGSIAMTQRYAHLSHNSLEEAVNMLRH